MAVELAQAYVSITPSARGIGRSLSRELTAPLTTAGRNAGDSAVSAFSGRFVSGMAHVAKRAAQAFTVGLGAAGLFGIRTAANFEQTRIAFEGILGDVEKANGLLGSLRDFASKTPFEFTGLADSARSLLAVGFSADEIIPTMTTLGNVAATLGVGEAEIAGVVRALGQMRGKGKASAEELQQISEQIPGFSAIKAIAEDMGITTAEAFERMAKGAIPADKAIESILNGMEDFPGAAGAMGRQSKTLNGVISTFKDTLSGMAIDFITPYLPSLAAGVQSVSGFLEKDLIPLLQTFIGWVGDLVDRYGPGLSDFFTNTLTPAVSGFVTEGLQAIADWWGRNREDIIGFLEDFGRIAFQAFDKVQGILRDYLIPAIADFGGWFIDNGGHVALLVSLIAGALAAYTVSAITAAAASLGVIGPFLLVGLAVGSLAALTNYLIDRWHLMPKAAQLFQLGIDHVLEPILHLITRLAIAVGLLEELRSLLNVVPGVLGVDEASNERRKELSEELGIKIRPRAAGGPVTAGMPYVVGEKRPELFMPDQDGTILPSVPTGGGGGFRDLTIIGALGEDPVERAFRESRRASMLAGT